MKRRKFESRVILWWKKYGWIPSLIFRLSFWISFLVISYVVFGMMMFADIFHLPVFVAKLLAIFLSALVYAAFYETK